MANIWRHSPGNSLQVGNLIQKLNGEVSYLIVNEFFERNPPVKPKLIRPDDYEVFPSITTEVDLYALLLDVLYPPTLQSPDDDVTLEYTTEVDLWALLPLEPTYNTIKFDSMRGDATEWIWDAPIIDTDKARRSTTDGRTWVWDTVTNSADFKIPSGSLTAWTWGVENG